MVAKVIDSNEDSGSSRLMKDALADPNSPEAKAAAEKETSKKNQEAAIKALLPELGGDNPQNRAIAEGLFKQGVTSTKNIGVKTENRPAGDFIDPDTGERSTYSAPQQVFYDKTTNKDINPTRLGQYDVKDGGKIQGNIFFHLNADDNGKVSFSPQWSPRAHGFLRDNAVGQAIMSIGKIIPSPVQPFFVAAGAIDALAHGKVMQAVAAAIPYGIQQLAGSAELLSNLSGNADFVATAKTAAGKIAEAAGAPSYAADLVGKVATAGVTAGISGGDVGAAMLKAGAGSVLGQSKDFLKTAGDFSNSGIGSLIPEGVDVNDFDPEALSELGETLEEFDLNPEGLASLPDTRMDENGLGDDLAVDMRADENGLGGDLAVDTRADENGLGNDLAVDTRADENGIGSLNNQDTVAGGSSNLETKDGIAGLKPVAYDDEGNLMPGYELDENNDPVWVGGEPEYSLEGGAGKDYVSPSDGTGGMVDDAGDATEKTDLGTVTISAKREPWEPEGGWEGDGWGTVREGDFGDDIDLTAPLTLPPGADPDKAKPEEPYLLNPDEPEGLPKEPILKVPPIFPPKTLGTRQGGTPVKPTDGLDDIVKGLVGGTVVGKVIDGLNKDPATPTTPALADPLKGNYNFSWNKQETKGPEKGVAYSQRYYGNQWTQQSPEAQVAKAEQPEKLVAITSPVDPVVQDMRYIPSETNQTQFAEGGLMSLGGVGQTPMFKPTMTDSGISAGQLSKDDVTGQAIQHMRKGGHVIDDKAHKEVSYLAGKGEPVHHIVGFMNHRKRMAEGGITSHSLGSYSDGGHLLKGPGDGMSDDIPATIADKQPARLANEEFVIPADVVSHLGNGSSESGAKVLYDMMARIRKARTGNPKQGKQINPHKLLPKV
jgi:hypothetical protein